jgi:hypothetical protein
LFLIFDILIIDNFFACFGTSIKMLIFYQFCSSSSCSSTSSSSSSSSCSSSSSSIGGGGGDGSSIIVLFCLFPALLLFAWLDFFFWPFLHSVAVTYSFSAFELFLVAFC